MLFDLIVRLLGGFPRRFTWFDLILLEQRGKFLNFTLILVCLVCILSQVYCLDFPGCLEYSFRLLSLLPLVYLGVSFNFLLSLEVQIHEVSEVVGAQTVLGRFSVIHGPL